MEQKFLAAYNSLIRRDFMKNIIPISILSGITLGNTIGMVLTAHGMSTGLLMGNAVGILWD